MWIHFNAKIVFSNRKLVYFACQKTEASYRLGEEFSTKWSLIRYMNTSITLPKYIELLLQIWARPPRQGESQRYFPWNRWCIWSQITFLWHGQGFSVPYSCHSWWIHSIFQSITRWSYSIRSTGEKVEIAPKCSQHSNQIEPIKSMYYGTFRGILDCWSTSRCICLELVMFNFHSLHDSFVH